MKTYDLLNALGALDDETVLSAHDPVISRELATEKSVFSTNKRRISRCARNDKEGGRAIRRFPRAALIAAVLAVVLCLGAVAYYVASHANTVSLMEAGPMSGGRTGVEIDETAAQVIDAQSVDYNLSVTANGTTVTLESLMGYSTETDSLLYLTFTLTPPAGTVFPEDVSEYGFVNEFYSFPFDAQETPWEIPAGGGSGVAVRNADGSVSVMLMRFFAGPVENAPLTLTLEDFALVGKSAADAALERQQQERITGEAAETPAPLLEGVWVFELGRIHLPAQQAVTLDGAALEAAGFPYHSLTLTPFGGKITMDDTAPSVLDRLRTEFPAELAALNPAVDWAAMTEDEFAALLEEGSGLTDDEDYRLRLCEMLGWLEPWDYGGPSSFTIEYPDGAACTVEAPNQIWQDVEQTGEIRFQILFPVPQNIEQATALVINETRIPLS